MADSKMDQIRALREASLSRPVVVPVEHKVTKPLALNVRTTETVAKNVACPVCEARRLQTLERVRRYRAKKITK